MTGLIRKRAKAGMTIPAAPRMTSASLRPEVLKSVRHLAFMQVCGAIVSHHGRGNPRSSDRRRRPGRDDGGPAVRPRRRADARAREACRLPPRFPRRHRPSLDAWRSSTSSACSSGFLERPHDEVATLGLRIAGREMDDRRSSRHLTHPGAVHRDDAAMGIPRFPRRRGAPLTPASRCAMERRGDRLHRRGRPDRRRPARRRRRARSRRGWSSPPTAAPRWSARARRCCRSRMLGAPMDVFWFRLPKTGDGGQRDCRRRSVPAGSSR